MQQAITELCKVGAIKKCKPCSEQFLSAYFLVPKSNGKARFVLNLKPLNKFIKTDHFKMEDIKTVRKIISQGSYMATLDIRDAYFLIPIHKGSRKFLRFMWEEEIFEFQCLPFGLCSAPWLFTKIMKPVASYLRSRGWMSVVYLDDWLLIGNSVEQCKRNVEVTCNLLTSLGFIINIEKSKLEPSTSRLFLGFIFDSVAFKLYLPEEKKQRMLSLIENFTTHRRCKIRDFARLLGTFASACWAIEYGWVYYKPLEREKYLALLLNKDNFDAYMSVSIKLDKTFSWWKAHIGSANAPIRRQQFVREIFSDASLSGWGAACKKKSAHGFWKLSERTHHINYLELLAAYFALRTFANDLCKCEVLLRLDNTVAISYINRMGGIKFPLLNEITKKIWQWCEERNLWIFASYISSKDNVEADRASRIVNIDTEWELSHEAFEIIVKKFGYPDIDLFASRINKKCARFFSWHKDPEALGIDAFTISWNLEYFYAFPPFSLILKVLNKIKTEQACGIVVAPLWTAQPWFPLWKELIVEPPIIFESNDDLLLSPCRSIQHPLARNLQMMAGKLSGRHL